MAVAAAVVLACLAFTHGPVNPVEIAIFSQVQRLPEWAAGGWHVLVWFGSWPSITLAAGLALYLGRIRLAAAFVLSGALAWFLAGVVQWLTPPRPAPAALAGLRTPGTAGFDFPDVKVAVVAALATAAAPYVGRATRQLLWVAVVAVAVGGVFIGTNLPLDAFAGAVLGWGCGRFLHLLLGAPGRRASEEAYLVALRESGLTPVRVTPTSHGLLSPRELEVHTDDGKRLEMRLVRRLRRTAGPVHTLRRTAASVESENEPRLSTPRHEVDHEAYLTLVAERAGVGVVPVLVAGEIDHGPAFLVRRWIRGRPLSEMPDAEVTNGLLTGIWRNVTQLGSLHIAHHDLRATNLLVDDRGRARLSGFTLARIGGPPVQHAQDVAELLVSLTSVVGVQRAVSSAVRTVPRADLEAALPHLQWLALNRRIRSQCTNARAVITDLRETLAERLDLPVPSLRSPVRASTMMMLLAGGGAVYLLLPQLSSMNAVLGSLAHADWWWLAVAVTTGLLCVLIDAVTIFGSTSCPLPVGRTVAVQVAAAFTGRTTPSGVGFYGVNLTFLEKVGLRRSHAVGALLLNKVGMGVASGVLTALGLVVIGGAAPVARIHVPVGPVVGVCVAVVLGTGAVVLAPWGRRRIWAPLVRSTREVVRDLLPLVRRPVKATQLFGGSAVFLVVSALGLAATLSAFHVRYPLLPVLAVYLVGTTLGQLVPTPGGLGAVEAALVAGLTAIGLGSAVAVAAVLASRLLTYWLPAVFGVVAFRVLQYRDVV